MATKRSDEASRTGQRSVSVTGQVSVRGRSEALAKPDQDTGGGAYIGGSVTTGGGDFIGRDQIKTVTASLVGGQQGITVEEFLRLLGEVRTLLARSKIEQDTIEVIEGDFKVVEQQAAKEKPNGAIIKNKLKSVEEMAASAGKATEGIEKIIAVLGRLVKMGMALFA